MQATGKKAQKQSRAQQKANEIIEKEKWHKTMMLESDDEGTEESQMSEVDEDFFLQGMQQALQRSTQKIAAGAQLMHDKSNAEEENEVVVHQQEKLSDRDKNAPKICQSKRSLLILTLLLNL